MSGKARVVEVAAGVVFRQGRVLITQRRAEDHLGGLWEFPGGKREPGETFAECLKRELMEELGIEVKVGEVIDSITHAYPEKTVRLEFLRCQWLRNEPRAIGCAALAWVGREELGSYQFPEADGKLLDKIERTRELWL